MEQRWVVWASLVAVACAGRETSETGSAVTDSNDSGVHSGGGSGDSGAHAAGGASGSSGGARGSSGGATGTGGVTSAGGAAGGTGGAAPDGGDASDASETADAGGSVGVPCGDATCDPRIARCIARPYEPTSVSCTLLGEHPCSIGCVVATCDGPEDCASGETCLYSRGENEYLSCGDHSMYQKVCSNDSDCGGDLPRCLPVGENTDVLQALLGWQPRACSPGP